MAFCRKQIRSFLKVLDYQILEELINLRRLKCSFLSLVQVTRKKKKTVVLLGDFNADLLKYDHDDEVADFLDAMYSKLLLPNISSPTRITSTSAMLIDNIFTNNYDNTFTSGNLVTTLSDRLAQILIVPIRNITRYKEPKKVYRDFQEILKNKDTISRYLQNTNWDTELQLNSTT